MRRWPLALLLLLTGFVGGLVVTGRMEPGGAATARHLDAPDVPAVLAADDPAPPAPQARSLRVADDLPELSDVAEQVIPSVVNISVEGVEQRTVFPFFFDEGFGTQAYPTRSAGSGVVIGADMVVTNAHVLGDDPRRITIVLSDRRERQAEPVGVDRYTDLALLRVRGGGLTPIRWGDSSQLRVAEWVMAIGNPYQLSETVTLGIVSAVGRTNSSVSPVADFIQTDAAINPGNSGGALVNRRGELVGINTWIISDGRGYQGIGFAVPSNTVREVTDQLAQFGTVRRGYVSGITRLTTLNPILAKELGLRSTDGALVYRMVRSGDAYAAGIRPGDVIVAFNGTPVNGPEDFEREMLRARVGSVATLRIRRGTEEFNVKVPITEPRTTTARRR
jgi:S1-C subfamily serine protease